MSFEAEAEACGIAERSEDACRIVHERASVEHADDPRVEIADAAAGIEQLWRMVEAKRKRVHGEIAAAQIIVDRTRLRRWQRARAGVGLPPRRCDVDAKPANGDCACAEACVRRRAHLR